MLQLDVFNYSNYEEYKHADALTTGGSIVKLKNMAHPDAFSGRVHSFSMALMQLNDSLTAIVTWLLLEIEFNFSEV